MKSKQRKLLAATAGVIVLTGALLGCYVLSILWRVSVAEHEVMGRDLMLHVIKSSKEFNLAPTFESRMAATFVQDYKSLAFPVWRDKINGFQHTYGSALAAYEFGDYFSDKLFVANEFAEWFFDKNGVSLRDIRDRHRDLSNNKVGRKIGVDARSAGYTGHDADEYMRDHIVAAIEFDHSVITHWLDPVVDSLPSEAALGCPNLPTMNGFDCYKFARRKVSKTKHRIARRMHYYWNKIEALVT